jgi:serine/threonine protein kinase
MQNQDNIDNIYNIIDYLGSDGNSKMYRVRNANNNTEYMAKVYINNQNNFQQELQMTTNASNLNNPNIIHLNNHGIGTITRGGITKNNKNYLILDYCSKGDLLKYTRTGRFPERHAKFIFRKILNGVRALHQAGICHRYLSLSNILLDQNFNPKISNFDFSTLFQDNNGIINLNDLIVIFNYAPPQIMCGKPYNGSKSDIFSLGVILFSLVVGRFGFNEASKKDQFYRFIMVNQVDKYWESLSTHQEINLNFSQEFKDLYIRMVSFNENNRPTIDQILNHNWFNELQGLNNEQLNQLENEVRNEFLARENQIPNVQ